MNNKKYLKIIIGIIVIIVLAIFVWKLKPFIKELSTTEGQIAFKEKVNSLGFKGFLLLFGLQIAQILLVIIPGEPLEVLAGMCYGVLGGTIFITASVFITTTLIFFIVRKLGRKYIDNFFEKEKTDKLENSKLLKNSKTVEITLCLLFLIPGTPKDLFVYIGGLLPIKPIRFILISTFVRFPSVITSTLVGAKISTGNFGMIAWIYGITFAITAIIIYIVNKRDKNKEIQGMF